LFRLCLTTPWNPSLEAEAKDATEKTEQLKKLIKGKPSQEIVNGFQALTEKICSLAEATSWVICSLFQLFI